MNTSTFVTSSGPHECEVYRDGPEAGESSKTWAVCTKNPGHSGFVPYPDFSLDHLPAGRQTAAALTRVRQLGDRTTRLRVGYTSTARPDGYAFSNVRGTKVVHTGSGWLDHVRCNSDLPCPCPDCASSTSPRRKWYTVWVFTACHVVYDANEAKATQVDFFYDEEMSLRDGKVKTIWGFDVSFKDPVRDVCILGCATHDIDLAQQLDKLCLFSRMSGKPSFVTPDLKVDTTVQDCVIVSHPHGGPKQVTVGEIEEVENTGTWEILAYSTNTCPGSSGAAVLMLDADKIDVTFYPHLHSRGGDFNHASAFYYRPLHHRSELYSRLQDQPNSPT